MKITILTLFDEVYTDYLNSSIIKRAVEQKLVEIEVINFRKFSTDKHHKVDDYQFGGGPGMVLELPTIVNALRAYQGIGTKTILTSPSGRVLSQKILEELKTLSHIILIAGHYEGFDARIEHYIDDSLSIGDYILTGGELPSLVMVDALVRLLPGVISQESLISESFNNNLLDYPVYTKPVEFEGHYVPDVLLSGNHQAIAEHRLMAQLELTKLKRNDLYQKHIKMKGKKHENK